MGKQEKKRGMGGKPNKSAFERIKQTLRKDKGFRGMLILLCALILLAGAAYIAAWHAARVRIERDAQQYQSMYALQTQAVEPAQTAGAPEATLVNPMQASPAVDPSAESGDVLDIPLPTPNSDTLVYALETPPPVQEQFAALLAHNPDTVGFLSVGADIALPVAHRKNDNDFYLNHNFSGEESSEGALFLDGVNRLSPEDDCLIVYGHNMNNGTMFGTLKQYLSLDYLKQNPIATFNTIYRDGYYVPFAAFTASTAPNSASYFDVRQFVFDETSFELFTLRMQTRSAYAVPVDIRFGDKLLLLVTCDHANSEDRFILALRRLRDTETAEAAAAQVKNAQ